MRNLAGIVGEVKEQLQALTHDGYSISEALEIIEMANKIRNAEVQMTNQSHMRHRGKVIHGAPEMREWNER